MYEGRSARMTIVLLLLEAIDAIYTQPVAGFTLLSRPWKEACAVFVCILPLVDDMCVCSSYPLLMEGHMWDSHYWHHNTHRIPRTVGYARQYKEAMPHTVRAATVSAMTLIWHPKHGKGKLPGHITLHACVQKRLAVIPRIQFLHFAAIQSDVFYNTSLGLPRDGVGYMWNPWRTRFTFGVLDPKSLDCKSVTFITIQSAASLILTHSIKCTVTYCWEY